MTKRIFKNVMCS